MTLRVTGLIAVVTFAELTIEINRGHRLISVVRFLLSPASAAN
jgi:hypothetical protein